jgi:hypothetical protein
MGGSIITVVEPSFFIAGGSLRSSLERDGRFFYAGLQKTKSVLELIRPQIDLPGVTATGLQNANGIEIKFSVKIVIYQSPLPPLSESNSFPAASASAV